MVSTVPTIVRCRGNEAHWTTATGVWGARPCSIRSAINVESFRIPMKITSVSVAVASFAQS